MIFFHHFVYKRNLIFYYVNRLIMYYYGYFPLFYTIFKID